MELPTEIWHHVLSFLTRNKILNIRKVSKKWDELSLSSLKWSTINIGIRYDEEVTHFCQMIQQSSGRLKLKNFCIDLINISLSKLEELANEICLDAVSYYFDCDGFIVPEVAQLANEKLNTILNLTTNLEVLHICFYTELLIRSFQPPVFPLKNLKEFGIYGFYYLHFPKNLNFDVIMNWIRKAPSLKIFYSNFSYSQKNYSEVSEYIQLLQNIPEVCMRVHLNFEDKYIQQHIEELSRVHITEVLLNLNLHENYNHYNVARALNTFFEKHASHLKNLLFNVDGTIKLQLPMPVFQNLETITLSSFQNVSEPNLPFDPMCFPKLKNVRLFNWNCPLENQFSGYRFTTVTKLKLTKYSIQDWKTMFPMLKKFSTGIRDKHYEASYGIQLDAYKHLLNNPPTHKHLVIRGFNKDQLEYMLENPPKAARLDLYIDLKGKVVDLNRIGNIPNLCKLKIEWNQTQSSYYNHNDLIEAILSLTEKQSFTELQKLILIVDDSGHSFNKIENKLALMKKHFSFIIDIRNESFRSPGTAWPTKCPSAMMYRSLSSTKHLFKLYNINNNNY